MTTSVSADVETVKTIMSESIKEFCYGMGFMFDIKIQHGEPTVSTETLAALKDQFKDLSAAYSVEAKGSIDGTFYSVLDQRGMFTMPGVIVMHPARRIEENCRKGTFEEVEPILDAIGETGNLLVGALDKIARETFNDKTHLLQTGTHAGKLADVPDAFFEIPDDEEFTYMAFEITVESHDPFVCGVIIPTSLYSGDSES